MGKNIVVFSDGTAQEGGRGHNSNVYKLFNMVEDRTDKQVAFYDRGLGTGWRKLTGNISGMGISTNILECYRFIFDHFEADDSVFLFGFSRGATTVRSLSGFIHLFGILPKSRPELIRRAYRIYSTRRGAKKRSELAAAFVKKHHTMWCTVKFLGVWDTVTALGFPLKPISVFFDRCVPLCRHRFHDLRLSESVENARHALAIDDRRLTFHPELWDAELKSYQSMRQVWFCGMHSDVGGGYPEQALSDIPLEWVVKEATDCGLRLYEEHQLKLTPDPDGTMHDTGKGVLGGIYRKKERFWCTDTHGKPVVHESVLQRKLGKENTPSHPYRPWILDMEHDVEPWPRP